MKRVLMLLLCAVLIFSVFGCENVEPEKVTSEDTQKTETNQTKSKEPKVFRIGEKVAIGNVVITINGVREHKSQNQFIQPKEGYIFYVLDITIENVGEEPYNSSTLLQMKLADSEGYQYDIALIDSLKGSLDGEIGPGRKLRGEVGFEIPKDATGLEFIYDYDPFGHGQAIFKLDR